METISILEGNNNADSRNSWEVFTPHRKQVMSLLLHQSLTNLGSICLLGSGNCNDVDLKELLTAYDEVTLIDLDPVALQFGIGQQKVKGHSRLSYHPEIDISGIIPYLDKWLKQAPTNKEKANCLQAMSQNTSLIPFQNQFDVVVSCCMISQIFHAISLTQLSSRDKLQLTKLIRYHHLKQLLDLTPSKGTVILISDMITSDTVPELSDSSFQPSPPFLSKLVKEKQYFSGLNPFAILTEINTQFPWVKETSLSPPWIWPFHKEKSFLAYAIHMKKGIGLRGGLKDLQ